MKLLFLTANEQLDGGLLQSQLVKPVAAHFGGKATIVNLHRPLANRFRSNVIRIINIPFLVPFRFVNFRVVFWVNEVICLFYALAVAMRTLPHRRGLTLVCRGYVPGLIGWWLNFLLGVRYIFDPRSLYVHEHVGSGDISEGSLIQRYWLWVERRIICRAERTVCVSKGMVTYYEGLSGEGRNGTFVLIPCFAAAPPTIPESEREKIRRQFGYAQDDLVIAYFGSLNRGWNNLSIYSDFFQAAGANGAKILIISQDAPALKKSALARLPHVFITGGSNLKVSEATMMLNAADYGVVLMGEVPDWETRLSVKFAEYTCAGLPVIVGKFVGEAARLVRSNELVPSIVVDGEMKELHLRKATTGERQRIRQWATNYFSDRNVTRLLEGD